jgi:DNA modification methylase
MSKENKITPAKGRPMLRWVGKKPLDYVKGFPAQLVEVFDPLNKGQKIETPTYDTLKDNWENLLFHGDNKEVMAALIENGFRGKVHLVYIDPPFKSGADYIRKVELRGLKNLGRIEEDEASILQQTMYFDIWNNDAYLQFMYERLILLKELLSEDGSIYLHCDWHSSHHLRCLMDEVFGGENLRNEIVWQRLSARSDSKTYNHIHDTLFFYSKGENVRWNKIYTKYTADYVEKFYRFKDEKGRRYSLGDLMAAGTRNGKTGMPWKGINPTTIGKHWVVEVDKLDELEAKGLIEWPSKGQIPRLRRYLDEMPGIALQTLWDDISLVQAVSLESQSFPTQKPEALLERIIRVSSLTGDIVLDSFVGSGTTAAVAQKLGRRWIGCDMNKGCVQMTSKRLQKVILDQIKKDKKAKPQELPRCYSFGVYQVNNYDLQLLKTEAVELATQHIGIQRIRTDIFFDGTLGKSLVKIIDFNHPLTLLDLQLIQDELRKRPNEDRDITIVCLGKELPVDPQIEEWNKKHPVNKLRIIELKTDKKYGHFLVHNPAEAKVAIHRVSKNKTIVEIQDFISPTIIERLNIDSGLLKVKIPDFRCMIDTVLIDTNYDGKTFHIIYSDVPEKKDDLVKGKYEMELSNPKVTVAIKIIDMLGEEVLLEFKLT